MSAASAAAASSSKLYLPGQPIAGLAPPLPSTGCAARFEITLLAGHVCRTTDARVHSLDAELALIVVEERSSQASSAGSSGTARCVQTKLPKLGLLADNASSSFSLTMLVAFRRLSRSSRTTRRRTSRSRPL